MAKLYTKQGDKGKTRLVTGKSVGKSSPRLDAYGTVDELNSFIGVARSHLQQQEQSWCQNLDTDLKRIQDDLFTLGSRLACDQEEVLSRLPQLGSDRIEFLEQAMDSADLELEPLKNFILPGGHLISSQFQLLRAVCRRAEREIVKLSELEPVEDQTFIYINRLSDYFFSLSRLCNHRLGIKDEIWRS